MRAETEAKGQAGLQRRATGQRWAQRKSLGSQLGHNFKIMSMIRPKRVSPKGEAIAIEVAVISDLLPKEWQQRGFMRKKPRPHQGEAMGF